jgi:hypothetical protein
MLNIFNRVKRSAGEDAASYAVTEMYTRYRGREMTLLGALGCASVIAGRFARRETCRAGRFTDLTFEPAGRDDIERGVIDADMLVDRLCRILPRLTPKERAYLAMRLTGEGTFDELNARLGFPSRGAFDVFTHRLREKVRALLGGKRR